MRPPSPRAEGEGRSVKEPVVRITSLPPKPNGKRRGESRSAFRITARRHPLYLASLPHLSTWPIFRLNVRHDYRRIDDRHRQTLSFAEVSLTCPALKSASANSTS